MTVYETPQDLRVEARIAEFLEGRWKCELKKLPKKYSADFLGYRNDKAVVLVEIKARSNTMTRYNTYAISLYKCTMSLLLAQFTSLPFILVVQFTDYLTCVQIKESYLSSLKQMTNFRGDINDVEPCVHIPISEFKILKQLT